MRKSFPLLAFTLLILLDEFLSVGLTVLPLVSAEYYRQDKWQICSSTEYPDLIFCEGHLNGAENDPQYFGSGLDCYCFVGIITRRLLFL